MHCNEISTKLQRGRSHLLIITAFCAAILATSIADAGLFVGLGFLANGNSSKATGISKDGSVVVGESEYGNSNNPQAFRWTSSGGMVGLGFLPGGGTKFSHADDVSADGSTIVGNSSSSSGGRAYRWTSSGGMVNLGVLTGGGASEAFGASSDGSIIVGFSGRTVGDSPFRWTSGTGMVALGVISPVNPYTYAYGISSDGSVVFGAGDTATGNTQAFKWTSSGGYTLLGFLPGAGNSGASGSSSNGTVLVGYSGGQAWRWTAGGGMLGIGILPGYSSTAANAVSGDGSIIVGDAQGGGSSTAFVWTSSSGIVSLQSYLTAAGLGPQLAGWQLTSAIAISQDGLTFVGSGIDPQGRTEAWIAKLGQVPEPSSIVILAIGVLSTIGYVSGIRQSSLRAARSKRFVTTGT